jgi:oligopeptide transport system substrate-binding protein
MFKKVVLTLVVVALVVGMAGCKKAQPTVEQVLKYNVGAEPQYFDPRKATGIPEFTMLLNLFDGLMRYNTQGQLEPSIAESYTVSDDKLVWTIKLRKTAKWSNGDPVTAGDFEYSWKTALSPEVASEYSYQLYYLKNGEAFNTSIPKDGKYYYQKVDASGNPVADADGNPVPDLTKPFDVDSIGVKALDDYTLQVTLEAPTPYFTSLLTFTTYLPINKKLDQSNPDWAKSADNYISNGPFKLTKWEHNHVIEMEKNPNYWDKDKVKLDKIIFYMVEENTTEMTMFENGEIDWGPNPPPAELERLQKEGKLTINPYLGTYYYMFNVTKKPFDDVRVRKALSMAIDREAIVKNITKAGELPATAYVPPGIPDAEAGSDFRKVGGDFFKPYDPETAKQLLAEAGYPDGKGFPKFVLLYNTSERHKTIAEAIQRMWKETLGIECTLTNQEWKVYLDNRQNLNYDVARAGWIGDYTDPMTFIDMWVTGGGNNDSGWSNKQYDEYVKTAKSTDDQKVRMDAMHKAETIVMEEMPIVPIYFYTRPELIKPYIKDAYTSALGYTDFKYAYIEAH